VAFTTRPTPSAKRLLPRMRRLFNRVRLEKEEVAILRGMLTTFETPKRRG